MYYIPLYSGFQQDSCVLIDLKKKRQRYPLADIYNLDFGKIPTSFGHSISHVCCVPTLSLRLKILCHAPGSSQYKPSNLSLQQFTPQTTPNTCCQKWIPEEIGMSHMAPQRLLEACTSFPADFVPGSFSFY